MPGPNAPAFRLLSTCMEGRCRVDKLTPLSEADHHALGSLNDGFARAQADYEQEWTTWNASLLPQGADDLISSRPDLLRTSAIHGE